MVRAMNDIPSILRFMQYVRLCIKVKLVSGDSKIKKWGDYGANINVYPAW